MKCAFLVLSALIVVAACGGKTIDDLVSHDDGRVDARVSDGGAALKRDGAFDWDVEGDPGDAGAGPPMDCRPGNVSSFSPKWRPPSAFHQNKCTAAQVDALVSCRFDDTADPNTCLMILRDATNDFCAHCIFTTPTDSQLGPVVMMPSTNVGVLNVAGCIANAEGNPTASSCGARYQAATDCIEAACAPNCPDDDFEAKNQCSEKALTTVCATYARAADCSDPLLETGGAAEACYAGNTFAEAAAALAKLFCGN